MEKLDASYLLIALLQETKIPFQTVVKRDKEGAQRRMDLEREGMGQHCRKQPGTWDTRVLYTVLKSYRSPQSCQS